MIQTTPLVFASSTNLNNMDRWPVGGTHSIEWGFVLPPGYAGEDLTVKVFLRLILGGTGTAVLRRFSARYRDVTAKLTIESNVAMNFTPGDALCHVISIPLAGSNFQAGDAGRVRIQRLGDDGADNAGEVSHDGGFVEWGTP